MSGRRATAILALTCAAALCGCAERPEPRPGADRPVASLRLAPAPTPTDRPEPPRRARPSAAATVAGALQRARAARRLTERELRGHRRIYRRARASARRLSGARRQELRAALAVVDGLAARRLLTSDRIPAAFLSLRRNHEIWTRRAIPRPGERLTFRRDAAVFQHFPGRGVAFHPLASFGRLNGLARECLERRHRHDARRRAWGRELAVSRRLGTTPPDAPSGRLRCRTLRRGLDRLAALGARRRGFLAWEYLVAYGRGTPPWISGMAQATAVQALTRAGRALDEPRYLATAERALGAFERPPPNGVRVPTRAGSHYLLYSFDPGLRVLNGFLQSVLSLRESAELSGSRRARRLFRSGDREARRAVAAYDTGAWSLYASGGLEAPLGYHELMRGQLRELCRGVGARAYCRGERRFSRYLHEPPRVTLGPTPQTIARRPTALVFSLSKVSSVRVRIRDRAGSVLRQRVSAPRGRHTLSWTPRRRGRHRLRIDAVDPAGNRTVVREVVRVRRPPGKKPSRKHRRG